MLNLAQDTGKAITIEPKKVLEIERFAGSFLQHLFDSKDLNQVPEKFFAPNFKKRFTKSTDWFDQDPKITAQISSEEHYQYEALMVNFTYLIQLYAIGKNTSSDSFKFEDSLPPDIVNLIKNNSLLLPLLNEENEGRVENVEELRNRMSALKTVVDAFRIYLVEHTEEWKPQYEQKITNNGKKLNDKPWARTCMGKDCQELPLNTPIIYVDAFPLVLAVVTVRGDLKIIDIQPFSK